MNQKIAVLIVEDQPVVSAIYRDAIVEMGSKMRGIEIDFSIAKDCDSARHHITSTTNKNGFDIVLLDMSLPKSKDGKINSGEDIGIMIRRKFPKTKIIVCTSQSNNLRIHSIVRNLDPEGFLVKQDFDLNEFKRCVKSVLAGRLYFSLTVLRSFKNHVANGYKVDEIDRLLLYELSIGTRMKELPKVVPLCMTAIEGRKRQLKENLGLKILSDRELIVVAKEKGFI